MTALRIAIAITVGSLAAAATGSGGIGPPYQQLWALETGTDVPETIAVDASGAIVVAGTTVPEGDRTSYEGTRSYMAMYDAAGAEVWSHHGLQGAIAAVTFDPSGAVTIVANVRSGTDSENGPIVMRIDEYGTRRWERRLALLDLAVGFDILASDIDVVDVAADSAGNVAIVGSTLLADGKVVVLHNTFVTVLDADGATRWTRTLERSAPDSAAAVTFDKVGDVVVTGGAWGAIDGARGSGTGAYLWKLDPTGNSRWVTQFGASIDDAPSGVTVGVEGTIFVIGRGYEIHEPPRGFRAFVRAFDVDGAPLWTRPVGQHPWDSVHGVVLDVQDAVLVLANTARPTPPGTDASLWGFTTAGAMLGDGPLGHLIFASGRVVGHAMAQDADGAVVVVGAVHGSAGAVDGFVIKMARQVGDAGRCEHGVRVVVPLRCGSPALRFEHSAVASR